MRHSENHRAHRIGWLRAAVLGANDGIVSTASLIVGVAAAESSPSNVLVAGIAGLVAGAMSMAAGEYVSVSSQSDTEQADMARERKELAEDDVNEHAELAAIYVNRGLEPELAKEVAVQLMKKDALGAHARDELGISEALAARPVQAAFASAATFAVGAALPLLFVARSSWARTDPAGRTRLQYQSMPKDTMNCSSCMLPACAASAACRAATICATNAALCGALPDTKCSMWRAPTTARRGSAARAPPTARATRCTFSASCARSICATCTHSLASCIANRATTTLTTCCGRSSVSSLTTAPRSSLVR